MEANKLKSSDVIEASKAKIHFEEILSSDKNNELLYEMPSSFPEKFYGKTLYTRVKLFSNSITTNLYSAKDTDYIHHFKF